MITSRPARSQKSLSVLHNYYDCHNHLHNFVFLWTQAPNKMNQAGVWMQPMFAGNKSVEYTDVCLSAFVWPSLEGCVLRMNVYRKMPFSVACSSVRHWQMKLLSLEHAKLRKKPHSWRLSQVFLSSLLTELNTRVRWRKLWRVCAATVCLLKDRGNTKDVCVVVWSVLLYQ